MTDAIVIEEAASPVLHRDLSQIEVNDLDGITINRTKSGISPFVPIIKTPNYAENSGNLTGYSVEMEDPETETGYRHIGNVSKNYLLLSNEDVRALSVEIAMQSGLPFKETRIFWDGSRFLHVIDFDACESLDDEEIGLGLITRSSYDKTWRYEIALMGKRFVCDNGMISGEFFARVSFKHLKNVSDQDETWQEIVREGLAIIDQAPDQLHRFVEALQRLRATPMTEPLLRDVWQRFPTIGDSLMAQIMTRYVSHEEPTMYGFLNAGTNVFWHQQRMKASDVTN
ncbi:MAG: DUF932 domain-containing protein, partial [Bacteroidota bacterium]